MTALSSSEEPTVITFRLIPGDVTDIRLGPLFPAATMTVIPLSQAALTLWTKMDFSSSTSVLSEPTEILRMRIL